MAQVLSCQGFEWHRSCLARLAHSDHDRRDCDVQMLKGMCHSTCATVHVPQYHVPQYHVPQYHVPQYHVPLYHVPQYHATDEHLCMPRVCYTPLMAVSAETVLLITAKARRLTGSRQMSLLHATQVIGFGVVLSTLPDFGNWTKEEEDHAEQAAEA